MFHRVFKYTSRIDLANYLCCLKSFNIWGFTALSFYKQNEVVFWFSIIIRDQESKYDI